MIAKRRVCITDPLERACLSSTFHIAGRSSASDRPDDTETVQVDGGVIHFEFDAAAERRWHIEPAGQHIAAGLSDGHRKARGVARDDARCAKSLE